MKIFGITGFSVSEKSLRPKMFVNPFSYEYFYGSIDLAS